MKRFKGLAFLLVLLMAISLFGCSQAPVNGGDDDDDEPAPPPPAAPIKLIAGGISPPTATISIAAEKVAELVEEKSGGRLTMDFFPAQQLGSAEEMLENLQTGAQDILLTASEWAATLEGDFNIMAMPYLFEDTDHLAEYFESQKGQEAFKRLTDNYGIRVMDYSWWRLARTMISVNPMRTPADVVGINFRVPNIPIMIEHVRQLEATPTPVTWAELYMGLSQGVVAAENATYETIYPNKFHEVAPYIADLDFAYSTTFVFIAESTYQSLPDDLRKILYEAVEEGQKLYRQLTDEQWEEQKGKIAEEGGQFIEVDRAAFAEKVIPMADRLEAEGLWSKGLAEYIKQLRK